MPVYDYFCEQNGHTIAVKHGIEVELQTWGEVCYAAQVAMGETDFLAPVRKVISPPAIAIATGNAALKNLGFTKLVKRDGGVYENVTKIGNESRYMRAGDSTTVPHLHKKVTD